MVIFEKTFFHHAQFRRNNPLPYKEVHTLLDGVQDDGHYGEYSTPFLGMPQVIKPDGLYKSQ